MTRKSLTGFIMLALLGSHSLAQAQQTTTPTCSAQWPGFATIGPSTELVPAECGCQECIEARHEASSGNEPEVTQNCLCDSNGFTFYMGTRVFPSAHACDSPDCQCPCARCASSASLDTTRSNRGVAGIANEDLNAWASGEPPFQPVEPLTHHLAGEMNFGTHSIQQQSPQLTQYRANVARRLTEYLTSKQHDAEHIRTVIGLALDAAADSAHREGMHAVPDALVHSPHQQASAPATDDLQQLKHEQMRQSEMIVRLQHDIQSLARGMSDMNTRTSSFDQFNPQYNQYRQGRIYWASQPESLQSTPPGTETREQLRARIRDLENQLYQNRIPRPPVQQALLEAPLSTSTGQPNHALQPASYVPGPLRPERDHARPLRPVPTAAPDMVTVSYYVGDLMAPPFASATLQLVQYIKAMVAPHSWDDATIQIAEPAISLVITQSRDNHHHIGELLRQIRAGFRTYRR